MTNYRSLVGQKIKKVSSDPSDALDGQVWYNTTEKKLKGVPFLSAWASASPLSTARDALGGFGTQTVGLMYGGSPNSTEEYNGSGFSTGGALNTARATCQDNGWGVQTAGVVASGSVPGNTANVEEYNGSSFSEVNNVSTARRQQASIGLVQTAGAICGGYVSANTDATEEYDGTNWTSGGNLNTSRRGFAGSGTLTAGIVFSGYTTTVVASTEEYDGTSWTTAANINTARNNGIGASNSPQSTALLFGGNTGSDTGKTEQYNGTSWTETSDMATARDSLGGVGIGTAALAAGGAPPPGDVAIAEEFNQSSTVITAAAWSSGGDMNTARGGTNGTSGDKTAGATFGGQTPGGRSNATELYDGSSWTNGTNTPAARRSYLVTGTQTASLLCGGQPPTPTANGDSETFEFDGSSFTDTSDINNARDNAAGAGTQTAGLAVGGRTRPGSTFVPNNNVEEYNGSSWTTANTLPAANSSSTSATGPQTAAIYALANPAYVASYDGTNWTAITATQTMPNSYTGTGVAGTDSSNAYMGGGEEPGGTRHGYMQKYDGTSWASQPSFSTARNSFGYSGTSPLQLICGGQADPGNVATTEEFTVETTALNVKTLTTS